MLFQLNYSVNEFECDKEKILILIFETFYTNDSIVASTNQLTMKVFRHHSMCIVLCNLNTEIL